MNAGGQVLWNVIATCAMFKTFHQIGKLHTNGPIVPFGVKVKYHPISTKDAARLHEFGKRVLSAFFVGHALAGGSLKGDIQVAHVTALVRV